MANFKTISTTYSFDTPVTLADGSKVSGSWVVDNATGKLLQEDITVAGNTPAENYRFYYDSLNPSTSNITGPTYGQVTGGLDFIVTKNAAGTAYNYSITTAGNNSYVGTDSLTLNWKTSFSSKGVESVSINPSNSYDAYSSTGGSGQSSFSNGTEINYHDTVVCYAKGTLIKTQTGLVSVEKLKTGDLLLTASGAYEPVLWVGYRTVDCKRHPNPSEAHPVRIVKDAFGLNQPHRDLFLSPLHSVYVDGIFIPAIDLVNGFSVIQEERSKITYFHVELPSHNVIYAEGLLAESYLDDGNRTFFVDNQPTQVVDISSAFTESQTAEPAKWFATVLRQGPEVDAVKARLLAEAANKLQKAA